MLIYRDTEIDPDVWPECDQDECAQEGGIARFADELRREDDGNAIKDLMFAVAITATIAAVVLLVWGAQ